MKLESKIARAGSADEKVFNFLTDFNNFENLIPKDKVEAWESDKDWCRFKVNPIGNTGIKILEKEPFTLIKLSSLEEGKFDFSFWVQIKQAGENNCYLKLTLEVHLNAMLEMMAKKPLQEFLDKLVDQLSVYPYPET
ncbi:MAG: hypothetical protein JW801_12400 [Bacteroidales bacterium]|nr:hypothetical protein [Bacteroidales bacterium]